MYFSLFEDLINGFGPSTYGFEFLTNELWRDPEFKKKALDGLPSDFDCFDISFWSFVWNLSAVPHGIIPPEYNPLTRPHDVPESMQVNWAEVDPTNVKDFMFKVKLMFFNFMTLDKSPIFQRWDLLKCLVGVYERPVFNLGKYALSVKSKIEASFLADGWANIMPNLTIELQPFYPTYLNEILKTFNYDILLGFWLIKDYEFSDYDELQTAVEYMWPRLLDDTNAQEVKNSKNTKHHFKYFMEHNHKYVTYLFCEVLKLLNCKYVDVLSVIRSMNYDPIYRTSLLEAFEKSPIKVTEIVANLYRVPSSFTYELWDKLIGLKNDDLVAECLKCYRVWTRSKAFTLLEFRQDTLEDIFQYFYTRCPERSKLWLPFVRYARKEQLEPTVKELSAFILENIEIAAPAWGHLLEVFPELILEYRDIIPSLCSKSAFEGLKYTIDNLENDYIMEHFSEVTLLSIDHDEIEVIIALLRKVHIEQFLQYKTQLWRMVEKLRGTHQEYFPRVTILIFYLCYFDEPSSYKGKYHEWKSMFIKAYREIQANPIVGEISEYETSIIKLGLNAAFDILGLEFVETFFKFMYRVPPFGGGFIDMLDHHNCQKILPFKNSLFESLDDTPPVIYIYWKLFNIFPNDNDIYEQIWPHTLLHIHIFFSDVPQSPNFGMVLSQLKSKGLRMFGDQKVIIEFINSVMSYLKYENTPNKEWFVSPKTPIFEILLILAKYHFEIPYIDRVFKHLMDPDAFDEILLSRYITFLVKLIEYDRSIIDRYAQKLMPFVAISMGMAKCVRTAALPLLDSFYKYGAIDELELPISI